MKSRAALAILLLGLVSTRAHAAGEDMGQAKAYFKAGAAAYAAGDYQAAIQALEAAYRLTPLPAIAFSLAQAERRQYFVSRERAHLERAIELYRTYLQAVPIGGRRADATDALAQLEPLALAGAGTTDPAGAAGPASAGAQSEKTRLLVTTEAPNAVVSLDGGTSVPSPLIAEVSPGEHGVKVQARGYFPAERRVVAVAGALVPVEVPLRVRPAIVSVKAPPDADLYIDGRFAGKVEKASRLELSGGFHAFAVAKKGHRTTNVQVLLVAGEARQIQAKLAPTSQRTAAYVTLGASAVSLGVGITFTALSLGQQAKATDIYEQQSTTNITPAALEDYQSALDRRGQFRTAAIVSGVVFAGTLVTGLCLYEFDHPDLGEAPALDQARVAHAPEASVALVDGPGEMGAAVRLSF